MKMTLSENKLICIRKQCYTMSQMMGLLIRNTSRQTGLIEGGHYCAPRITET
jgi:hypothetical protein